MSSEPRREPEISKLFRVVKKHEATDLYLEVGEPPKIRLRGHIRRLELRPLTQGDMERVLYPIMDDHQRQTLDETGTVNLTHAVGKEECRFFCTVTKKQGQLGLAARLLKGT
jgi:twitching motility protein PilT